MAFKRKTLRIYRIVGEVSCGINIFIKKTNTNTVIFLVCTNTVHRRPLVIISLQKLSVDTRKQEVEKRKLKNLTLIGQFTKTQALNFYRISSLEFNENFLP